MSELDIIIYHIKGILIIHETCKREMIANLYKFTGILIDHMGRNVLVKDHLYSALRELIEMGPHAPEEPEYPACGIPKFQELVGIKT